MMQGALFREGTIDSIGTGVSRLFRLGSDGLPLPIWRSISDFHQLWAGKAQPDNAREKQGLALQDALLDPNLSVEDLVERFPAVLAHLAENTQKEPYAALQTHGFPEFTTLKPRDILVKVIDQLIPNGNRHQAVSWAEIRSWDNLKSWGITDHHELYMIAEWVLPWFVSSGLLIIREDEDGYGDENIYLNSLPGFLFYAREEKGWSMKKTVGFFMENCFPHLDQSQLA